MKKENEKPSGAYVGDSKWIVVEGDRYFLDKVIWHKDRGYLTADLLLNDETTFRIWKSLTPNKLL